MKRHSTQTHTLRFVLMSLLFTPQAYAKAYLFLWDNNQGITNDQTCKVEAIDRLPYKVSQYSGSKNLDTENIRNYNGVRQSHLVNHSIVKERIAPDKRGYLPITVVGINERTDAVKNRWFSERGSQGYLYNGSLRPMEDFVFSIKIPKEKFNNKYARVVEGLDLDKEIFLRVAAGASYYTAKCKDQSRNYYLFRAYQRHQHESAMMYIGVSDQETSILSSIRTYGKVESKSFLSEVGNEGPIRVSEESFIEATEVEPSLDQDIADMEDRELEAEQRLAEAETNQGPVEEAEESEEVTEEESEVETTEDVQAEATTEEPEVKAQSFEKFVCIGSSSLNVRDETLEKVEFEAVLGEKVKVFQSWGGGDSIEKTIGGVSYTFRRVEFPDRESDDRKVGFVASRFLKAKEDCPYLKEGASVREAPVSRISGIDDANCCDFPTVQKPTHSYTTGMRRFGAGRGGGTRLHAACDLYRYKNEPARSIAPGKVVRGLYYFYQGTYALEVRHDGGFVVRYGELTGKQLVRQGRNIRMGQNVGNIGKVNSNCCRPMLHFELYSGSKTGPLKSGGRYQRRSDLMNPTNYLLKWERKVF